MLGYGFLFGDGVTQNITRAHEIFEPRSVKGFPGSQMVSIQLNENNVRVEWAEKG
jgi:hypothetical protein